jgi:hypothetical protein
VADVPSGQCETLRWFPRCVIEKYSADQVAWVRKQQRGWLSARAGRVPALPGYMLQGLFAEPEDGVVYDTGNGVTSFGVANLALLLTGQGGHPLSGGRAVFGVGSDGDTAFSREHVHLANAAGEEPGRSWYKPMDPGFPRPAGMSAIEGQATFTEHEACFSWREWCWGSGPARPGAHHSLRGAYRGEQPVMMNRKASKPGYGVKEPGVAWVFRTQVELS